MKNLLDEGPRQEILSRFDRLEPTSERRWGRLDVGHMVCHVSDPFRIALGDTKAEDVSNLMTRSLLRWMVLAGMPPPKGKIKTFPEVDPIDGTGTQPTSLDEDREALKNLVVRLVTEAPRNELKPNPGFGSLQFLHLLALAVQGL